ncbi:MAG: tRNA lysidine(34) synthetase TilS [Pseudomonadota bacterium]|nr:tRNA lysidine(34) synthetase TilS [Pseudomonadota bacterium]
MMRIAPISRLATYHAAFASSMRALDLETADRFITALSGGPDSTALACLADFYARSHGKHHLAVIVNHNIRPNSTNEAVRVSQRMKSRAIANQILNIQCEAPKTGLQNWARDQRYTVLTKLARQQGAVLLVAHHQADQAETVIMRLANGSGVVGLVGMRGLTTRDAVLVARPLLEWQPEDLVDLLGLLGCDYEDDPSNQNRQFKRVQIRGFLRDAAESGLPLTDSALRLGRAMKALSNHLDTASSTLWQAATCLFPTGHAIIDMDKLSNLPQPAWVYRVRQLIRQIGGRPYGVSDMAVTGLHERLLSGQNSTLGGCHFVQSLRSHETARFYVVRELGRKPEVLDVVADDDVIFAGCWRVRTNQAGTLVHEGAHRKSDNRGAPTAWPSDGASLPYVARRAIPVIITLDGEVSYPQIIGANIQSIPTTVAFSAQFMGWQTVCIKYWEN